MADYSTEELEKIADKFRSDTSGIRGTKDFTSPEELYDCLLYTSYFKIGSMKTLCRELDGSIRYRRRMCIWKHWKTPQNRAKNLMKLDVPRWAAFKIAYCGDRYARLAHNGWIQKAISTKRLTSFGLVSMLDYYTERCVTC